jgi:uncharacterized protein (TIGR02271 family)
MSSGTDREHQHEHTHADGSSHSHPHEAGAHHGGEGQTLQGSQGQATEGEIRVPVAEERLNVEKRQAELGEVQLRKTVEQEQVSVPVELQREEVRVDQRDVADRPVQAGDQVFQEGTIRVPVRGEEAIVTKEAVVTGEVVIEKERTTEREQITDTIRRERVEVDENYNQHRSGFQQHFNQRQQQAGGRSWEEAEPNYQYGYMAARNDQYQGRQFEDVEGDLRSDYQQRFGGQTGQTGQTGTGGSAWDRLREEVREGWTRARGGA